MMILPDGSIYPSVELLAFRAKKLAFDCPTGWLHHCPGFASPVSVDYALGSDGILFLLPTAVSDFPYRLANSTQRLLTQCQYKHMCFDQSIEFHGHILRLPDHECEQAMISLRAAHPRTPDRSDLVSVRLRIDSVDYAGSFPEVGTLGQEHFNDPRLNDDRQHYVETCDAFNEHSPTSLLRVARHYLRGEFIIRSGCLLRVDSYGITIRAETDFESRFLRIDFGAKAVDRRGAETLLSQVTAPGYDKHASAKLLHSVGNEIADR